MVYITVGMHLLAFILLKLALQMPSKSREEAHLFQTVFGLSGLRIFSSLAAFSASQLIDIYIYALIKRWRALRFLWLRANGSTGIAQLIDTLLIDLLFLYGGMGMHLKEVMPIMLFSILYKLGFCLLATPLFYLLVSFFKRNNTQIFEVER